MFYMVETDFIVKDLSVSYSGVFNLKEFYKYIKRWFKDDGRYQDINEKLYEEDRRGDLKITNIKIEAKKRVDDYTKFVIKTTINASDYEDVTVKGKDMQKGDLKVKFNAEIEKDYEERWVEKPFRKFFRGLYDKFMIGFKVDALTKELTDEAYDLYNEVKKYLNL